MGQIRLISRTLYWEHCHESLKILIRPGPPSKYYLDNNHGIESSISAASVSPISEAVQDRATPTQTSWHADDLSKPVKRKQIGESDEAEASIRDIEGSSLIWYMYFGLMNFVECWSMPPVIIKEELLASQFPLKMTNSWMEIAFNIWNVNFRCLSCW